MTDLNSTKVCSKCHLELSLEQFQKHLTTADGLRPECRGCVRAYRRKYYLSRQAELQRAASDYYHNNKDAVLAHAKTYASLHKHQIAKRTKRWRNANHEILKRKRLAYYKQNLERHAAWKRIYSAAHPEYNKASTQTRRARLRSVQGSFTAVAWLGEV